jgi:hypothetical protein
VIELLIPLAFVGIVSLMFLALLSVVLRLVFRREVWEAYPDRLIVRRGPLGFLRAREHRGGALLLEPHHESAGGALAKQWRVAVLADGEKHYLLPDIRLGFMRRMDAHREAASVANLLAEHTGWTVSETAVAVDGLVRPPSESEEAELTAALKSHRLVVDSDEQMRLMIRPPRIGQWIFGAALLGIGGVWLWILVGAVDSYLRDAQVQQEPALQQLPFWLMITPMLAVGVGMCALGVALLFRREHWIFDRNLVLVRARLFGWTSEHEYVNARWKLALVRHTRSGKGGTSTSWQVQLESLAGKTLKVFYSNPDDDAPRLLATLVSRRTGWDLREANS